MFAIGLCLPKREEEQEGNDDDGSEYYPARPVIPGVIVAIGIACDAVAVAARHGVSR